MTVSAQQSGETGCRPSVFNVWPASAERKRAPRDSAGVSGAVFYDTEHDKVLHCTPGRACYESPARPQVAKGHKLGIASERTASCASPAAEQDAATARLAGVQGIRFMGVLSTGLRLTHLDSFGIMPVKSRLMSRHRLPIAR